MSTKIPLSCPPDKGKMRSIMRIIIEEPILSLPIPFHEKGILSLAKSFTDNGSRLYLSDEELSKPLFTHRMTVNRAIQNLVKLGYLEKRVESREGGKSYRSLRYLGVQHSNKLHLCLDGDDETIATNCISDSNKLHLCSPSIATNCITHSNKLHHITKRNLKDHNLKVTERVVADAPLPTEPELKNSLIDLEPVKEPLETLAEPESSGVTHPPQVSPPPLPKKKTRTAPDWSQVQAAATPEQWAAILNWQEHRKQLKKPCTPLSVMMKLNSLGSSLVASIENSIANCYQGIFPPRNHQLTADPAMVEKLMRELVDLSKAPELFHTAWQRIKPLQAFNYDGPAREEYRKQLLESPVGSKGYDIKLAQLKKTIERRTH
jgi:hypothetical protein